MPDTPPPDAEWTGLPDPEPMRVTEDGTIEEGPTMRALQQQYTWGPAAWRRHMGTQPSDHPTFYTGERA